MSAANSTSSLLSKAAKNELSLCAPKDCYDDEKSLHLTHKYRIQTQAKKKQHLSWMKPAENSDLDAYGWCDLLDTQEWYDYIDDSLNDMWRAAFLDNMTERSDSKKMLSSTTAEFQAALVNSHPPYAISYKSMSEMLKAVSRVSTGCQKGWPPTLLV